MSLQNAAKRANTPLVHFLVLGLCLLFITLEPPQKRLVYIGQAQQQTLFEQWATKYGQALTESQKKNLINIEVGNQILFDQAQQRGLQELPVVQTRLQTLDSFLNINSQEMALTQPTPSLALTDPLIRQYMINAMRELLISEALQVLKKEKGVLIPEHEVNAYYQANPQEFFRPDKYQLNHIYIGGLGEDSLKRAHNIRRQIIAQPQLKNLGDAFIEGSQLPMLNTKQLQRKFGGNVAQAAPSLTDEQWNPPVASSYGYHLFYPVAKQPGGLLPQQQVTQKIQQTLQYQLRDQLLKQQLEQLKTQYEVEQESATAVTTSSADTSSVNTSLTAQTPATVVSV